MASRNMLCTWFQFVKLIGIFRNTLDYIWCTCFWPRPPPRNTHKYSEKYLGKHLFWASTPSELARSPQCRISAEQGFAQIAFLLSRYLYFSFLAHHPICFLGWRAPNINQAGKSDEDLDLVSCTVNFEHFGSYFDLGSKEHLNTFVI